jgi:hypothetical protein
MTTIITITVRRGHVPDHALPDRLAVAGLHSSMLIHEQTYKVHVLDFIRSGGMAATGLSASIR